MDTSLNSLVQKLVDARTIRKELEAKLKSAKSAENELVEAVQISMSAQGLTSANFPEVARICTTERAHYEIVDVEAVALYSCQKMLEAFRDGRPLSDGLFLQRSVSRPALEAMFNDEPLSDDACLVVGVRRVATPTLSIRKN